MSPNQPTNRSDVLRLKHAEVCFRSLQTELHLMERWAGNRLALIRSLHENDKMRRRSDLVILRDQCIKQINQARVILLIKQPLYQNER